MFEDPGMRNQYFKTSSSDPDWSSAPSHPHFQTVISSPMQTGMQKLQRRVTLISAQKKSRHLKCCPLRLGLHFPHGPQLAIPRAHAGTLRNWTEPQAAPTHKRTDTRVKKLFVALSQSRLQPMHRQRSESTPKYPSPQHCLKRGLRHTQQN